MPNMWLYGNCLDERERVGIIVKPAIQEFTGYRFKISPSPIPNLIFQYSLIFQFIRSKNQTSDAHGYIWVLGVAPRTEDPTWSG